MRCSSAALIATLSTIAFAQIAKAADLPRKAPIAPAPAVVASTWTGFYLGGNIGYSWGNADTDHSGTVNRVSNPGTGTQVTNPAFAIAGSSSEHPCGVIGGGQIGYNWQFSPKWVLGFEADIQASGERGSAAVVHPFSTTVCISATGPEACIVTSPATGTLATTYEAKINWFGTVRNRVGFLITDQLLLYATGGLAYGQVKVSSVTNSAVTILGGNTFVTATAASASKTNIGFAVGGGVEGKFWLPPPGRGNWNISTLT